MLTQFRTQYPHGSLISELITIDRGQYIVKVTLQVDGITLSTGLAAAAKIETAEDYARERALLALALDSKSNLADSSVNSANHSDQVINKPSNLVNLSFKQESTTTKQENKVNQVQSLPVNTSMTSTASTIEKIDSGVKKHLVELSNSPQETAPTDFHSSPGDVSFQNNPVELDIAPPEISATQTLETVEFDFNEIKNRTDVEIKRLGWTKEQGRDFLLQTYGKRSRLHLTDQELMDFLRYLESQPNP